MSMAADQIPSWPTCQQCGNACTWCVILSWRLCSIIFLQHVLWLWNKCVIGLAHSLNRFRLAEAACGFSEFTNRSICIEAEKILMLLGPYLLLLVVIFIHFLIFYSNSYYLASLHVSHSVATLILFICASIYFPFEEHTQLVYAYKCRS